MKKKVVRLGRFFAFIIGLLTLLWQVIQVANGNFKNLFFTPDILLGLGLILASLVRPRIKAILALIIAYAFSSGVFATATFGGLLVGSYDFGAFTTTLALIPCIIFLALLPREVQKNPQLN